MGQNCDLLGIPKTYKSLGILISSNKVGIGALKQGQTDKNPVFQTILKPFLKNISQEIV